MQELEAFQERHNVEELEAQPLAVHLEPLEERLMQDVNMNDVTSDLLGTNAIAIISMQVAQ